jgi:hypothetical protein
VRPTEVNPYEKIGIQEHQLALGTNPEAPSRHKLDLTHLFTGYLTGKDSPIHWLPHW